MEDGDHPGVVNDSNGGSELSRASVRRRDAFGFQRRRSSGASRAKEKSGAD